MFTLVNVRTKLNWHCFILSDRCKLLRVILLMCRQNIMFVTSKTTQEQKLLQGNLNTGAYYGADCMFVMINQLCFKCRVVNFHLRLFVILQTFFTTFYICLKPRLSCTSYHKTTNKHLRIQKFWLYFAKKFCDFRQKREKRPYPAGSSCAWAGL